MASKSKILIVGGTGYIGRRIVKASLEYGHETYVLQRRELSFYEIEKIQMLLSFKKQGAKLVEASFNDHDSLVAAVKLVDVVISAMSGVPFRSHNILEQLKLVDAIKDAGNIKRFIPSEFGLDNARMVKTALPQGMITFEQKITVRKAIEAANIPHTYVSANCFAGYFVPSICDMYSLVPPKEDHKVPLYGDGNVKAVFMDEDDIGRYTIKTVDDPETVNKTLYLRPPENILCQRDLIKMYEKLTGKKVQTDPKNEKDYLAAIPGLDSWSQVGAAHFYQFLFKGDATNFEIGEGGVEASKQYPEVRYTRMDEYMKQYL